VATDRTRILIDAGLSRREVAKRLAAIGEDIAHLDAVLVTHEHCDHASGLAALVNGAKKALPVYVTRGTSPFIDWGECAPTLEVFQAGCGFTIGDFDVTSFTIPHDAMDPVGFTLSSQGVKMAIATDLGYVTDSLRVHLRGSHVVILESNHDLEMLRVGPYPWSVKQRVMSRRGHLSNEVAAEFIAKDLDSTVDTVILGHISEHNNHPELVRNLALKSIRNPLFTKLFVAEPGLQSPIFCY
jgi:phosphoribosyl 1,2-cyclic phosphodiesterase